MDISVVSIQIQCHFRTNNFCVRKWKMKNKKKRFFSADITRLPFCGRCAHVLMQFVILFIVFLCEQTYKTTLHFKFHFIPFWLFFCSFVSFPLFFGYFLSRAQIKRFSHSPIFCVPLGLLYMFYQFFNDSSFSLNKNMFFALIKQIDSFIHC